MKEKLYIIKIGGNVLDAPKALDRFLGDFAGIKGKKILVHGGGKIATELGKKLGIETKMVEGRRITDEATIDLVTMTYAGLINKKVVAALQSKSCNAIGFSGADGNLIKAKKRPVKTIDYGFVGDIEDDSVNVELISSLLAQNVMPVVCPITHDGNGNLLNTNADTIAAVLAYATAKKFETHLFYCFEKNGVLLDVNDDTSFIRELKKSQFEELKSKKQIYEGMIPKLDNAFETIAKGVHSVYICNAFHLPSIINNTQPIGTRIC
ncbi:MAG: acetylglutamate kinase [Bacteroidetes bacterium]|nr:acetylglutamate kinase [Bacteroidota bacterium]